MSKKKETTVDDLVFDAANVRTHGDKNKKAIRNSVKQFKAGRSILVDADNVIRAGNGTAEAWQETGGKVRIIETDGSELIAVKRTDLKGAEAMAYAIADNRASELAEWDSEILAEQLKELDGDFDIESFGFDSDDLSELMPAEEKEGLTDVDEMPEAPKDPVTKAGDLWILGDHRLLCGDSTSEDDVAKLMEGRKADMLITDPPYGVSYTGKTNEKLTIENDSLDEDSLRELIRSSFNAAESNCREGSYWYATVPSGPLHLLFARDWMDRGILRQIMVWAKDSMVFGHSEYHYKHEPILFGWMLGPRHKNSDRTRTTLWEYDRPRSSREHPTMKPVALWSQAITDGSIKGELVYDPFIGSGTTLIAAEQLGRSCVGMEISPRYCDVIVKRWEEFTGKKAALESK